MAEMTPDEKLDLRGEACPYNFVKTKLKLESMEQGKVLEITLDEGEAMKNVPASVKEEGHRIVGAEQIEGGYKLLIKKG